MASREDLLNAISLNSSIVNGARVVGPSVAGLMIGAVGVAMCFFLNGLSFIAVIISLYKLRVNFAPEKTKESILTSMKQGFGFMRVYTDQADSQPFDHAYPVEHGDTVLIPRGYHPVVACPGYSLNYTWVLAGEGRTYGAWSDDPKHSWIKS
jgi:hypothetical protein